MSRFNKANIHTNKKHSAISTTGNKVVNHYGATGYERDVRSELYLLAVSFMGGDSNFYEKEVDRYDRLRMLTSVIAVEDPEWIKEMIRWVRNGAMMRTVAGVMAVEAVRARLMVAATAGEKDATSQGTLNREIIDAACARADEPGETLSYYLAKYGKPIPYAIKKGIGDAATRLYNERSFLRYGSEGTKAISFRDVIRLTHPKPKDDAQDALFSYITNPEQNPADLGLDKIGARNALMTIPQERRKDFMGTDAATDLFLLGEMGWENISSWLGTMDREAWEAVIPNMGVMALLRNLRNFDKVDIPNYVAAQIGDKLADPEQIKRARVLPLRFLNAYKHAPSMRWSWLLEQGLNESLSNVPKLDGRTLILVDVSPSMTWEKISEKSTLTYYDAATIFGAVLAVRNPGSDLVQFGGASNAIEVRPGESVLKVMEKFHEISYTDIPSAVRNWYHEGRYDRVIILTDEQSDGWGLGRSVFEKAMDTVRSIVPTKIPVYTWNFAGYKAAHGPSNWENMHVFGGGFSDAAFGMIHHIESGAKGSWPWETSSGVTQCGTCFRYYMDGKPIKPVGNGPACSECGTPSQIAKDSNDLD